MRAGQLKTKLILERPDQTENIIGEAFSAWKPITMIYANIQPEKSIDTVNKVMRLSYDNVTIIVRADEKITKVCRFRNELNGDIYQINGVIDNQNGQMTISATKADK